MKKFATIFTQLIACLAMTATIAFALPRPLKIKKMRPADWVRMYMTATATMLLRKFFAATGFDSPSSLQQSFFKMMARVKQKTKMMQSVG